MSFVTNFWAILENSEVFLTTIYQSGSAKGGWRRKKDKWLNDYDNNFDYYHLISGEQKNNSSTTIGAPSCLF